MPSRTRAAALAALSFMLILAAPAAAPAQASTAADDSIAAALRRDGVRHAGSRVVLWVEPGALPPDESARFHARLDSGFARIERLLGRTLDRAHYDEDTVQVFVGRGVGVSHVYAGYAHQRHRRPWLYLDAARVLADEAPWAHEATHLVAWRFGSHSLREGLASWVEATLVAQGAGPRAGLFDVGSPEDADARAAALLLTPARTEVLPWIGRAGTPDATVTSPQRPRSRAAYYVLSQSFAQHVVRHAGVATALALYEAEDEAAWTRLTRRPLEAWRDDWVRALEARATASGAAAARPTAGATSRAR